MLKHSVWFLSLTLVVLCARGGVQAQPAKDAKTDILKVFDAFLRDNKRFSELGGDNYGLLRRIEVSETDAILKDALKSKNPVLIEKAFFSAIFLESASFAKQAKKKLKADNKDVRRAAQFYVFAFGNGKDKPKALTGYLKDGRGRSIPWYPLCYSLGPEFAKACTKELKKNKNLSDDQRVDLIRWLNAQLGTRDQKASELAKQYSTLSKAVAARATIHNEKYAELPAMRVTSVINGLNSLNQRECVISDDGRHLFVVIDVRGGPAYRYRCYSSETGETVFETPAYDGMSANPWMVYSSVKKRLVVVVPGAIKIFDVPAGVEVGTYPVAKDKGHTRAVILPKGDSALVKVGNALFLHKLGDNGKSREVLKLPKGTQEMPGYMVVSEDGALLAYNRMRAVYIVDLGTGKELWTNNRNTEVPIAFTANGELHFSGNAGSYVKQHWLFNTKTGQRIRRIDGSEASTTASSPGAQRFYVTHDGYSSCFLGAYDTGLQVARLDLPLEPRETFDIFRNAWINAEGTTVVLASVPSRGIRAGPYCRLTMFRRK